MFYSFGRVIMIFPSLVLLRKSVCPTLPRSRGISFSRLIQNCRGRSSLIINVEYNQLDPILRATVSPEGDINDPATGLSPFPGNTNNLVFMLDPYLKVMST